MTDHTPDPIDIHVGARLRQARKAAEKSQVELADALGVTFQQVQKYERGTNRVSASMLHRACACLQIPVGFFFEGLIEVAGAAQSDATFMAAMSLVDTMPEITKLAGLSPRQRFAVRDVINALADHA